MVRGNQSFDQTWRFRNGRHLERCSDNQNEVHTLPILLQRMVEVVCEFLPEESYVGLRESPGGRDQLVAPRVGLCGRKTFMIPGG